MNEDGRDDVGAGLSKLVASSLPGTLKVEGVGRNSRPCGFDLAPKVLGLVHKELLAVGHVAENVLLKANNLILLLLVVIVIVGGGNVAVLKVVGGGVGDEAGGAVGSTLDSSLDGGEDGLGGKEIDTAVNKVADVGFGFLDVVKNALGVSVGDDATEVLRGLFADTGAENDSFSILVGKELQHVVEGE